MMTQALEERQTSGRDRIAAVRVLGPLLWAGGVLGLSLLPGAVSALPALGALRGPLGVVVAVLAVLLAAGRAWRPRLAAAPAPGVLFAVTAVLYVGLGLWYASRLRVSGDEPHYLLMAQSLWREHDLDLRDNLAREDWREYTPGPVAPHWGAPRRDGRPFPAHGPGLPLLLAPVYAAGGRLLCVAVIGLAAAALTLQVRALALRAGADERGALLAWAAAAGPPVAFYALHVYTEVPSALALAASLRLLLDAQAAAGEPRAVRRAAGAALLAVALPWLHVKMAAAAAALGLLALGRLRGRARLAFAGVAALGAALYAFFFLGVYGLASPMALYGGTAPGVGERRPLLALAGLLLDRSFGLLPYAPLFLLALAGLPRLLSRARADVAVQGLLATGLAVLAPVLAWRMWWGGQCPPARFLVPLVPLLAVAAGALVSGAPARGLGRWRWPLAGLSLALTLFMAADPGRLLMLNRGDRQTRVWTALSGPVDVGAFLPSLVAAEAADLRALAVWAAALAALLALHVAARRSARADAAFRSLGLPLLLALLVGAVGPAG
jgi:hypothetical protein